jgi:hypothetical protein
MPFSSTIKSIRSRIITRRCKQAPDSEGQSLKTEAQIDAAYSLPPLKVVDLPLVLPEHRFALADQGWTKITYQTPVEKDVLYNSAQALFQASKTFFDLPAAQKNAFETKEGSEEGWSFVEGEKEFITLRSIGNTPPKLKEAATAFCKSVGFLLLFICRPRKYPPFVHSRDTETHPLFVHLLRIVLGISILILLPL